MFYSSWMIIDYNKDLYRFPLRDTPYDDYFDKLELVDDIDEMVNIDNFNQQLPILPALPLYGD